MATRRSRRAVGADQSRSAVARATAIAEQLRYECSALLELYVSIEDIFDKFSGFNLPVEEITVAQSCSGTRICVCVYCEQGEETGQEN